jgi:hypothetical protein
MLDSMPIESVTIKYSEPQPGEPVGAYGHPKVREYGVTPNKVVMIHYNKRLELMTEDDLRKYKSWLAHLPAKLWARNYHPNFIRVFCDEAGRLAEVVQTRIYMAYPKSPDLHDE